jgi:dienelactone hydrolase
MGVMSKLRVAFVNTHPIQYFAPSHIELSDDGHVAAYVSDALVCGGESLVSGYCCGTHIALESVNLKNRIAFC